MHSALRLLLPLLFAAAASAGSYRGKVVVLAFGFTSCLDVCPITLATLAQARKKLRTEGNELQVVYITVDPGHDDALPSPAQTLEPRGTGA